MKNEASIKDLKTAKHNIFVRQYLMLIKVRSTVLISLAFNLANEEGRALVMEITNKEVMHKKY